MVQHPEEPNIQNRYQLVLLDTLLSQDCESFSSKDKPSTFIFNGFWLGNRFHLPELVSSHPGLDDLDSTIWDGLDLKVDSYFMM
ncbi:16015_t:CDS:2, partial [Funneliformis mosseae]